MIVGQRFQPFAFLFQIFKVFLKRRPARQALEDVFDFRRQFQQHFVEGFASFVAEDV